MHLHERMDKIFNNGSMWPHRSLRTVFDPYSSEWNETKMDKKIAILKKIVESGENLEFVIEEYKEYYTVDCKKPHVAKDALKGVVAIMELLLVENKIIE